MFTDESVARHEKILVVLSGGLDSTTAMAIARTRTAYLYSISFDYSQRHSRELESARKVAEYYRSTHREMTIPPLKYLDLERQGHPATWVPGRNLILLCYAAVHAMEVGASLIVTGIHSEDQPGYPDCRYATLSSLESALLTGLDYTFRFWHPLFYKDKKQIVARGLELEAPYHLTWTCYKGGAVPCGICDACTRRLAAFEAVGVADPTFPYTAKEET